jgi:hypothetical protein
VKANLKCGVKWRIKVSVKNGVKCYKAGYKCWEPEMPS